MHKLYCIIGRTASGKSTITKEVAKKLKLTILKSYTTRSMRVGETEENSDHTFISPDEVENYRSDMVAYTERVGYCSFATKQQLFDSNLYIINPQGYKDLDSYISKNHIQVELIPIYIYCETSELAIRASERGDFEAWSRNFFNEYKEFNEFENTYRGIKIENNNYIESASLLENIIVHDFKSDLWEGL